MADAIKMIGSGLFVFLTVFSLSNFARKNFPIGPDDGESRVLGVSTDKKYASQSVKILEFNGSLDSFSILDEAGSMVESRNKWWWLNSGGQFISDGNNAKTIQGEISRISPWRYMYAITNSLDTDAGTHPQNIFRLVTRTKWKNFTQQLYFKINGDNLSESSNRNESNGVLLFNRYLDGKNIYYAGLRVDGNVVVKKKINGQYYTMAIKKVFTGKYDKNTRPNLIEKNKWIGLRTNIKDIGNNNVEIVVEVDLLGGGEWSQVIKVSDDGKSYGGSAISKEGFAGIRTDFMDVEFRDYYIKEF